MPETFVKTWFAPWLARRPYVGSVAMVGAVTALGFIAGRFLHPPNLDMLYLLAVLISALEGGRRPAVFTAIVSAVVFDFCFIPPYFAFTITDIPYFVTLLGFVAVAFATSALAARTREVVLERDELLNKISHELRAPLNAVLGWTQLLHRAAADDQRRSRGLSGLEHSTQAMSSVVDDLLDTSRWNTGKLTVRRELVPLAPIVSDALDAIAIAAEKKGVHLESSIVAVGDILGDAHRIQQTVINLVSNAIKFTPGGGRVVVCLDRVQNEARLVVSDTGIGIGRDFLPHVFDPFSQADAKNGGLGLGLSIVRCLVEAHHGTIAVESAGEGRGATFTVCLPALTTEPAVQVPLDVRYDVDPVAHSAT